VFTLSAYSDIGPKGHGAAIKFDGTVDANTEEKHFINVINNEGSTIAAGSLVILDVASDDGASVVISTAASSQPLCVMVAACADNALCSCQTYGRNSAVLFDRKGSAAVAGAPFFNATSTQGYIKGGVYGGVDHPAGIFYDAATASGAMEVFIKLR